MTIPLISWVGGLLQLGLFIICLILGLFFIYKSKKTNATLLLYLGLSVIGLGLYKLFNILDFFFVILTGTSIYSSNLLLFFVFITLFSLLFASRMLYYMSLKLLIPEKKYYLLSLGLIFDILILLNAILDHSGNFIQYTPIQGENFISFLLIPGSPVFIFEMFTLVLYFIFNVFGLFLKGYRSKGVVKKKYFYFSMGNLLFIISYVVETSIPLIYILLFTNFGEICGILIIFFAVREVSEKPKEKPTKNEVKVEDGLFRLTKRPSQVTEEEVTFHREKKICLVCKGPVSKLLYMCSECEVLYCVNCFNALINAENVCWVCDTVLDESKPTKPFKESEEVINVKKEGKNP